MPVLCIRTIDFLLLVAKYIKIFHNCLPVSVSALSMIFLQIFQKLSKIVQKCWSANVLDINECQAVIDGVISKGGCQHKCTNTIDSYICSCNKGYYLADDEKTCEGR